MTDHAIKTLARDIAHGQLVQERGASAIRTPQGPARRINFLGIVVERAGTALIADDGTGRVELRAFSELPALRELLIGDAVLAIGPVRAYGGDKFLVPDILRKLSPRWVEYRRRELQAPEQGRAPTSHSKEPVAAKPTSTSGPVSPSEDVPIARPVETLLALIKRMDAGGGVAIEDLLAQKPGADTELTDLMAEGEIFEIRPGRVKVLE